MSMLSILMILGIGAALVKGCEAENRAIDSRVESACRGGWSECDKYRHLYSPQNLMGGPIF